MAGITRYYSRKGASGYYIPTGNDPYTFLKSLATSNTLGIRIGQIAKSTLNAAGINIDKHSIENGLAFLKDAADMQRAHETAFIATRLEELQELGVIKGTEIQFVMNTLEQIKSGNPIDYNNFIQSLNMMITNLERYEQRVKAFNTKAISNIPQVRMVEGLATAIGSFANSRGQMYYSQEEAIRQLAIKWLNTVGRDFLEKQIALGVTGAKNIAAALALITQQMARFIYDNILAIERHVSKADKKGKFADFKSMDEFIAFVEKINLSDFEHYTGMSADTLENDQLLREIQDMYGIDYDGTIVANGRKLSDKASKEVKEVKQILGTDPLLNPSFEKIMNHLTVRWNGKAGGNRKLSFQNELVSALAPAFNSHQHLGQLNMGTDILLGHISIDIEGNGGDDPVAATLQRISYRIQHESAINNVQHASEIYLEEMGRLNKALNTLKSGFVIHETTKNYNTLERGHWPWGMDSFSGREMKLTNYISAITLLGNTGVNVNDLAIIANNLATDAIGSTLKQPLEHILAVFGGIIMFDDFAIIGQEITQGLSFSNVQSLHLYKLQDTYFPASVFLDATYYAMKNLENELLEGNGFIANITVPTVNYYTEDGLPDYSYGEKFVQRWEGVRNFVEKNTTVHLHFAANFLSLMQQLL